VVGVSVTGGELTAERDEWVVFGMVVRGDDTAAAVAGLGVVACCSKVPFRSLRCLLLQ
jgi:hypothetical protein